MNFQQDYQWDVFFPVTYPNVMPDVYIISNYGIIINTVKSFQVSQYSNNKEYKVCGLISLDGCYKQFKVHRLVAWEFCPGRDINLTVNHKDGNKHNNYYQNLEWCTNRENLYHALEHGLINSTGSNNPSAKLTDDDVHKICSLATDPKVSFNDIREALNYKVSTKTIEDIAQGRTWVHISSQYNIPFRDRHYLMSGERNVNSKLTKEEVDFIRHLHDQGFNCNDIVGIVHNKVKKSTIEQIVYGRIWHFGLFKQKGDDSI